MFWILLQMLSISSLPDICDMWSSTHLLCPGLITAAHCSLDLIIRLFPICNSSKIQPQDCWQTQDHISLIRASLHLLPAKFGFDFLNFFEGLHGLVRPSSKIDNALQAAPTATWFWKVTGFSVRVGSVCIVTLRSLGLLKVAVQSGCDGSQLVE